MGQNPAVPPYPLSVAITNQDTRASRSRMKRSFLLKERRCSISCDIVLLRVLSTARLRRPRYTYPCSNRHTSSAESEREGWPPLADVVCRSMGGPGGAQPSTEDRARALQYIGGSPGKGAGRPERTKAPAKMSAPAGEGRPLPNSYWVVPGRFAAGEYPGAKDPDEAAARLRALLSASIDHFVDLTEPGEGLAPYAEIAAVEAARLGADVVHERHPVVDVSIPASPTRDDRHSRRHRRRSARRRDRLPALLGRSRPDRDRGRVLARAMREDGRRGPGPGRRVVEGSGEGASPASLAGDTGTACVRPRLDGA